MFLVEILLPLREAKGTPYAVADFESLTQVLTNRFGGVTSFSRSPADGRWRNGGATEHDDIVVIEVMAEDLDRPWWSDLRNRLMRDLDQDDIVIRSHAIERLV